MSKGLVVSLFDESGNMLEPWANAGYECIAYDILNTGVKIEHRSGGSILFKHADLMSPENIAEIVSVKPVIVFGFPPCTHLAVSGARHFESKRAANPRFQEDAVALCKVVEHVGELTGAPWMLENPVSVLATMWRKSNFWFHQYEYGGYLPIDDEHPRWPEYIMPRDAYPKSTHIWCGNGFSQPLKRVVAVDEGYSVQFHKLGGKSAKTKQIRSETPRGFAQAVFERNSSWIVRTIDKRHAADIDVGLWRIAQ